MKKESYSIEAMDPDMGRTDLTKIGEEVWSTDPTHKFIYYQDPQGGIWHETMIRKPDGTWVTREEFIFGKRLPEKQRKRKGGRH